MGTGAHTRETLEGPNEPTPTLSKIPQLARPVIAQITADVGGGKLFLFMKVFAFDHVDDAFHFLVKEGVVFANALDEQSIN